ncbi:MAG: cell division FtsA domain-containing protein [Bacillus sp. (in: firmicutes)]
MGEKLFALDIGTRSIVGIILEQEEEHYQVTDILSKEHTERSMLDGQIHDVLAVSKIITEIKEEMEKEHGQLTKVSVAAAGRALLTEKAQITVDIKGKPMIDKQDILHMEVSAVQQAQSSVANHNNDENSFDYYCVGYSVLYYKLDGVEIGSLIDQNGSEASVEIIATFLPKVVVESLISALKRSGLEMHALTLEPIAAINVLIPPSMRRINVALVDIGAGTSDIAITDTGTVVAYGMVPIAGDEITEAISDQLLLDFHSAELTKRKINDSHDSENITITDILGFETGLQKQEIVKQIHPVLEKLSDSICSEILTLNNEKPPKAVMLVGGGSRTPELPSLLASRLQLPANRVAVRGIDAIQNVTIASSIPKGPELVTPIGIAIAAQKNPVQYVTVYLNDSPVRLFDVKELTLADCLLTSGIKVSKLYGKPGMAKIVHVNGQSITIPGSHGSPPQILLNGETALLNQKINADDRIIVKAGQDGSPATATIKDLIEHIPRKTVIINQTKYVIEAVIKQNGQIVADHEVVEDRDEIVCKLPGTIESLIKALGLQQLTAKLMPFTVFLNDKSYTVNQFSGRIFKNEKEVKLTASFEDGDVISIEKVSSPTLNEMAESLGIVREQTIPVTYNGKPLTLRKTIAEFYLDGHLLLGSERIQYGERLKVVKRKQEPFIFQDLFRHVDIELPKGPNSRFILVKNEQETGFHESIQPGDDLRIMWPATIHKPSN